MTLAVVLATEPVASESTPAAGLSVSGGSVIGRLLAQLKSLDVGDRRVIARPEFAETLRDAGCEVVESKSLADDLREIARVARSAREPMLVLHGDVVAHRERGAVRSDIVQPMVDLVGDGGDAEAGGRVHQPIEIAGWYHRTRGIGGAGEQNALEGRAPMGLGKFFGGKVPGASKRDLNHFKAEHFEDVAVGGIARGRDRHPISGVEHRQKG